MGHRVFLSYRRSDSALQATALKLVLESKLPDVVVFVDTASIAAGEIWPERLRQALQESSAVIALVGPRWRFEKDGSDRIENKEDWVRTELAFALHNLKNRIIPVFVGDAPGISFKNLPADLSELPSIQAMRLTDERFISDSNAVALALSDILGANLREIAVEFPTPDRLKRSTPRISQSEFEDLKIYEESLRGWSFSLTSVLVGNRYKSGSEIRKTFKFKNFKRAFNFMSQVAVIAEARPHHPDWRNVWNQVHVTLRTFDADQSVTWYDVEMASKMEKIAAKVESAQSPIWPPITET